MQTWATIPKQYSWPALKYTHTHMMKKNPQHPFLNIVNIRTTEQKNIHSKVGGLNFYSKMANNNNNDDNKNMKCKKKMAPFITIWIVCLCVERRKLAKMAPQYVEFSVFFSSFYFPASTCYIRLYMFVVERMYKSNTPLPPPPPPPPPSSTFIQVTSGFPK